MKQTVLVAAFLAVTHLSIARTAVPVTDVVFYDRVTHDSTVSVIPSMDDLFTEITAITGHSSSFELKASNVLNLEVSGSRKKKYILYNAAFTDWITNKLNNKWGVALLLAHEIGHHMHDHLKHKKKDRHQAELEADEYAGFILAKMGASLEDAQLVMYSIAGVKASATHPARKSRLKAIRSGWEKCKNEL